MDCPSKACLCRIEEADSQWLDWVDEVLSDWMYGWKRSFLQERRSTRFDVTGMCGTWGES
jgi:hypothetical protein